MQTVAKYWWQRYVTGLVWQVWGPYPFPLWSLSHTQTAVSLGDKTDQGRRTDSLTALIPTLWPAFAILDIKNKTLALITEGVRAYDTEHRVE